MIFRILAKNVANITKASFHFSRLTFCQKKKFLEKMNSTLADFQGKNIRISSGKCVQAIFEGTNFAKRGIRIIFWPWERKFQTFAKVRSRAVMTAIYVSKGWILGKKFGSIQFSVFLGHRAKLFGLYATSFLLDYQLCIVLPQREFLGEICVWNLCFTFTDSKR